MGLDFQLVCGGSSPGHGNQAVEAIQVPVHVAGMDVSPGDIVHMDEHGATKLPREKLSEVLKTANALQAKEDETLDRVRKCSSSGQIRALLEGHAYGAKEGTEKHE